MKQFEFEQQKQLKPLPISDIKKLGLNPGSPKIEKSMEDLKKNKFNIVVGECIHETRIKEEGTEDKKVRKKEKLVMAAGVYEQIWYNTVNNHRLFKPAAIKFNNVYKQYNGENLDNKTILFGRQGGYGDLLSIQPNLIYLKKKYPTCKIWFSCGEQYKPMLKNWDCIDKLLGSPYKLEYLIQANYHAYFEGIIERCEEAHSVNAYHLFSRWLGLNLPDELLIPKQIPLKDEVLYCKEYLFQKNIDKFILMQLRASSPIRTPNPEVWRKVIARLVEEGHTIVITDSPWKKDEVDNFIKELGFENVYNFAGYSKTINSTVALVSLSQLVIGVDSSIIHIAASVGTKCLGIYGPFPGEIRLSTYKNCDWINVKKECAPCFIHYQKPCQFNSSCFNNLDIDDVMKRVNNLIN